MTNYVLQDTLIFKKVQNFAKKIVEKFANLQKKYTVFFILGPLQLGKI